MHTWSAIFAAAAVAPSGQSSSTTERGAGRPGRTDDRRTQARARHAFHERKVAQTARFERLVAIATCCVALLDCYFACCPAWRPCPSLRFLAMPRADQRLYAAFLRLGRRFDAERLPLWGVAGTEVVFASLDWRRGVRHQLECPPAGAGFTGKPCWCQSGPELAAG